MNTEYVRLKDAPIPLETCPKCKAPFEPFLRGQVYSFWRSLFGRPSSCLICRVCKEIVGHE